MPAAEVAAAPLYTVDSGPVSGVAGSGILGPKMGYDNIITTDMGGTTFDVGIVYKGVATDAQRDHPRPLRDAACR